MYIYIYMWDDLVRQTPAASASASVLASAWPHFQLSDAPNWQWVFTAHKQQPTGNRQYWLYGKSRITTESHKYLSQCAEQEQIDYLIEGENLVSRDFSRRKEMPWNAFLHRKLRFQVLESSLYCFRISLLTVTCVSLLLEKCKLVS